MPAFVEIDGLVPNMKQTITRANSDFVYWHIYTVLNVDELRVV